MAMGNQTVKERRAGKTAGPLVGDGGDVSGATVGCSELMPAIL